jgi:hypothetical protein
MSPSGRPLCVFDLSLFTVSTFPHPTPTPLRECYPPLREFDPGAELYPASVVSKEEGLPGRTCGSVRLKGDVEAPYELRSILLCVSRVFSFATLTPPHVSGSQGKGKGKEGMYASPVGGAGKAKAQEKLPAQKARSAKASSKLRVSYFRVLVPLLVRLLFSFYLLNSRHHVCLLRRGGGREQRRRNPRARVRGPQKRRSVLR